MKKLLTASLAASTFLVPAVAQAQSSEVDLLKQQIAAMQAQIQVLSARVEELDKAKTAATPAPAPVAVAVAAAPAPAPAPAVDVEWKGAPKLSGKGGWSFKPRGRLMVDAGSISAPDSLNANTGFGSEMRRARLGVEGDIPGGFGYKFEVDFAGNGVEVADAIISYEDGSFSAAVGQQNNFQSLEELTSSRYSSFIERAAFTDAFAFERRLGVSGQVKSGDLIVQAGLFSDNMGDVPGKSWSADGRIVFMPKLGDAQLHLGASVHHAEIESGDTVRYRQRPLVHFTSDRFINTGNQLVESEFGIGGEAAVIAGPFHAVGEIFSQTMNLPGNVENPNFLGAYAEAGFFLTGESRGYKSGVFDRTKPANPVDKGGMGALQVNLRYDYLDLTDANIAGGSQDGYFASLVWVPTAYTRLTLNYGRLEYSGAAVATSNGDRSYGVDVIGIRSAIDF